ncbi:hypothetical protein [Thermococcus sp. GR6]|uniref:hypothetical protein n=1 Tax=Thermococcus sp. GR6 TaxID=1638256 RepID=UPI00142FAB6E|nr:hypothetical protein [Thermococcus sp. GR6]NJE41853.1 hypothetical protein [Thermococcus sp. GR6]
MNEHSFAEFVIKRVSRELELTNYEIERLKELLNKQCLTESEKHELNKLATDIVYKLFEQLDKEFAQEDRDGLYLIEDDFKELKLIRNVLIIEDTASIEREHFAVMFRYKAFFEINENKLHLFHLKIETITAQDFADEYMSASDNKKRELVSVVLNQK